MFMSVIASQTAEGGGKKLEFEMTVLNFFILMKTLFIYQEKLQCKNKKN